MSKKSFVYDVYVEHPLFGFRCIAPGYPTKFSAEQCWRIKEAIDNGQKWKIQSRIIKK